MRTYSKLDQCIGIADQALKIMMGHTYTTPSHPYTDDDMKECSSDMNLSSDEKDFSVRLMRVNHAGEVAAQGLYHGQAITARNPTIAKEMKKAAHEEADHLAWCKQRIQELDGRTSILSPFWYLGALSIGVGAGVFGDRTSLGFIKETEDQVVKHLASHLQKVSPQDKKTISIIKRIQADEAQHAHNADTWSNNKQLPWFVKRAMQCGAKVMTTVSHYL